MDFELQVETREGAGRASSRRLRRSGKIPAVVYGGGKDPRSIMLEQQMLSHQMAHEAFFTSILTLKVGKDSQPVIIKDVQRHPYRAEVLHLDFQRIVADEAITLNVPLHYLGEDTAVGVKQQGGVVDRLMTDVEVSCLPKDLPSFIEVDVSNVELHQIMHLSDIQTPEGVTLVALEHGNDRAIFAITPPRQEEEDVIEVEGEELAEGEVEGEVEAEGEGEGEAPAESGDSESAD